MNKNFNVDNDPRKFIIPKGRMATVSAIQDYTKDNTASKYTGKRNLNLNKNVKQKNYSHISKDTKLHNGKVKMNYTQKEIFDVDNTKPKKKPKLKFKYLNKDGTIH